MTKAEREKRATDRELYGLIFNGLCTYVLGPKNISKYCIDCIHKNTASDKVVVDNGYMGYTITFYFDYRIRIFVKCPWLEREVFYQFTTDAGYDDKQEYVRIVTAFFRSLSFMSSGMINPVESYPHMFWGADGFIHGGATAGYEDCPDDLKEILPCFEYIVFHEWNDSNLNDLEYFTKLVGSKKFRRSMYKR